MIEALAAGITDGDVGGVGERKHGVDKGFDSGEIAFLHCLHQLRHRRNLHRLNQRPLPDLIMQTLFGNVGQIP